MIAHAATSRIALTALLIAFFGVQKPAFSLPTEQIPFTVIDSTPCAELLTEPGLVTAIRPLLKTVTDRSSESHGETVNTIIQRAFAERENAKNVFLQLQEPAALQKRIKKHIHALEFNSQELESLRQVQNDYGQEVVPLGPRPLEPDVYEKWKPIYAQFRVLGIHNQLRGYFGEWIAAAILPGTIKLNVHAKGAITDREAGITMKVQSKVSRAYWDWYNKQSNEIDIVFNNGQSIGEVKFYTEEVIPENRVDDLKEQAYKFFRLREIWNAAGIAPRDFYFIFIQNMPTDKKLLQYIHECGIKIIVIKIK